MWLLTKIWGLQRPNLLISVTGGAKNIVMSKKLKDAFKKGLLKTAQSTGIICTHLLLSIGVI